MWVKRASVSIDGQVIVRFQETSALSGVGPEMTRRIWVCTGAQAHANADLLRTERKMNLSCQKGHSREISLFRSLHFAQTKKAIVQPPLLGQPIQRWPTSSAVIQANLLEKEVPCQTRIFAADMAIELINDGPVTIILDTKIHRKTSP